MKIVDNFEQEAPVKKGKGKFAIDPESFESVMDILSEMYPDTVRAVLREYVSNARDANVLARSKEPVRITISDEPFIDLSGVRRSEFFFQVEDNGPGMTEDDVVSTYIMYGSSEKKKNNALIGGLGLGSKSAFALNNYFEIVAVQNGRKVGASFERNPGYGAEYDIIFDEETTAPNGVTVRIPLNRQEKQSMISAMRDMFVTWPVGSYTFNGEIPEVNINLWDETKHLPIYGLESEEPLAWVTVNPLAKAEDSYQKTDVVRAADYVLTRLLTARSPHTESVFGYSSSKEIFYIGGATYRSPLDSHQSSKRAGENSGAFYGHHRIIWNYPIGLVRVTPDRSAIMDNEKNIQHMTDYHNKVWDLVRETAYNYIATLPYEDACRWVGMNHALFIEEDLNKMIVHGKPYRNTFTIEQVFGKVKTYQINKGTPDSFSVVRQLDRAKVYCGTDAAVNHHTRGVVINTLIWGVPPTVQNPGLYRDVLPAVRDKIGRYVDSDNLFTLHVHSDQKPDADLFDGWVVIHVSELAERRKSYNATLRKYKVTKPKVEEVYYGVVEGKGKLLTVEDIEQAEKVLYVQEAQVSSFREWAKYFTKDLTSRYSYAPHSLTMSVQPFVDEYDIIIALPNNRAPKNLLKIAPDAVPYGQALQEKIDSYDPDYFALIHGMRMLNTLQALSEPPAHPVLAQARADYKDTKSEIRRLAQLVMFLPSADNLGIVLPKPSKLELAAREVCRALSGSNTAYFNKLMELYPEV